MHGNHIAIVLFQKTSALVPIGKFHGLDPHLQPHPQHSHDFVSGNLEDSRLIDDKIIYELHKSGPTASFLQRNQCRAEMQ